MVLPLMVLCSYKDDTEDAEGEILRLPLQEATMLPQLLPMMMLMMLVINMLLMKMSLMLLILVMVI